MSSTTLSFLLRFLPGVLGLECSLTSADFSNSTSRLSRFAVSELIREYEAKAKHDTMNELKRAILLTF